VRSEIACSAAISLALHLSLSSGDWPARLQAYASPKRRSRCSAGKAARGLGAGVPESKKNPPEPALAAAEKNVAAIAAITASVGIDRIAKVLRIAQS
jgi:hypothetical protein